jgi:F-type H+-transporting ATPase subunit epsilon
MSKLNLEILTPAKRVYSNNVNAVTVPGSLGSFQVLYNHAPLISTFEIGVIKVIVSESSTVFFSTSGGSIEVLKNKVRILADSLEAVEDIDLERAKNALQRAKDRLEKKDTEKIDVARAEAALERAINRINAVEKYLTLSK